MEDEPSGALTPCFQYADCGALMDWKAYLTAGVQSVPQKNLCWEW